MIKIIPKNKSQEFSWDLFLFIQLVCLSSGLQANQQTMTTYQALRAESGLLRSCSNYTPCYNTLQY
jgi:hypothetical protein